MARTTLSEFVNTIPFVILDNGRGRKVEVWDFYDETYFGTYDRSRVAQVLRDSHKDYHDYAIDPDSFHSGEYDRNSIREIYRRPR